MMKAFSTQFPLNPTASLEKLLDVSKKWIAGSRYFPYKPSDLAKLRNHEDKIESKGYSIELARAETDNNSLIGISYINPGYKAGDQWRTVVSGSKSEYDFWVSMRTDYTTFDVSTSVPKPKKPVLIRMLLEEIGGGMDGDIKTDSKPNILHDGDEEFVSNILLGYSKTFMPITYLSCDNEYKVYANPKLLAGLLSGISHVFVEPSRSFSFKLKDHMKGRNVYGGAIGAFWSGLEGRLFLSPINLKGANGDLERSISDKILEALESRRINRNLTWEYIKEIHFKNSIENLKVKSEKEKSEIFDDLVLETERLGKSREEQANYISKLEAQNRRQIYSKHSQSIIKDPQINQFYRGEISGVLIDALSKGLPHIEKGSRRYEIVKKIIDSTDDSNDSELLRRKIKSLFFKYRELTSQMRNELQQMGFVITGKKHHKLTLAGEEGGMSVTIPKTPSDYRAGKNVAAEINKTFF